MIIRRFLRYFFAPLFFLALLWLGYFKLYGNFHQVNSQLYRSAQLYSFNLPYYIDEYHFNSIINLRGASDESWYKDEIAISKEHNITHYDFGFGDRTKQSVETMNKLVKLMKEAKKPLLIHCKAGADRTSLASALYLYSTHDKENPQEAISIIYGHFPWLGSKTKAMDESFLLYQKNRRP